MSIQEEIHTALNEIQRKVKANQDLSQEDLEVLFVTSLIEEEAK